MNKKSKIIIASAVVGTVAIAGITTASILLKNDNNIDLKKELNQIPAQINTFEKNKTKNATEFKFNNKDDLRKITNVFDRFIDNNNVKIDIYDFKYDEYAGVIKLTLKFVNNNTTEMKIVEFLGFKNNLIKINAVKFTELLNQNVKLKDSSTYKNIVASKADFTKDKLEELNKNVENLFKNDERYDFSDLKYQLNKKSFDDDKKQVTLELLVSDKNSSKTIDIVVSGFATKRIDELEQQKNEAKLIEDFLTRFPENLTLSDDSDLKNKTNYESINYDLLIKNVKENISQNDALQKSISLNAIDSVNGIVTFDLNINLNKSYERKTIKVSGFNKTPAYDPKILNNLNSINLTEEHLLFNNKEDHSFKFPSNYSIESFTINNNYKQLFNVIENKDLINIILISININDSEGYIELEYKFNYDTLSSDIKKIKILGFLSTPKALELLNQQSTFDDSLIKYNNQLINKEINSQSYSDLNKFNVPVNAFTNHDKLPSFKLNLSDLNIGKNELSFFVTPSYTYQNKSINGNKIKVLLNGFSNYSLQDLDIKNQLNYANLTEEYLNFDNKNNKELAFVANYKNVNQFTVNNSVLDQFNFENKQNLNTNIEKLTIDEDNGSIVLEYKFSFEDLTSTTKQITISNFLTKQKALNILNDDSIQSSNVLYNQHAISTENYVKFYSDNALFELTNLNAQITNIPTYGNEITSSIDENKNELTLTVKHYFVYDNTKVFATPKTIVFKNFRNQDEENRILKQKIDALNIKESDIVNQFITNKNRSLASLIKNSDELNTLNYQNSLNIANLVVIIDNISHSNEDGSLTINYHYKVGKVISDNKTLTILGFLSNSTIKQKLNQISINESDISYDGKSFDKTKRANEYTEHSKIRGNTVLQEDQRLPGMVYNFNKIIVDDKNGTIKIEYNISSIIDNIVFTSNSKSIIIYGFKTKNAPFEDGSAIRASINAQIYDNLPSSNNYVYIGNRTPDTYNNTSSNNQVWKPQNGAFSGRKSDADYYSANSEAIVPEYNPHNHVFNSANEQKQELIANNKIINPKTAYKQSYNLFINEKQIAKRNFADLGQQSVDSLASMPQLLAPSDDLKNNIQESTSVTLNNDALRYLVNNNNIGQNAKSFAWKLLTLSDQVRNNTSSIVSDHIENLTQLEQNLKLFNNPKGLTIENVKFYSAETNNKTGIIDLYISFTESGNPRKIHQVLNKQNIDLKNDYDFIKYINDRTFQLDFSYGGYYTESDDLQEGFKNAKKNRLDPAYEWYKTHFKQYMSTNQTRKAMTNSALSTYSSWKGLSKIGGLGGTAWLVDRIMDPNLKSDEYAFVVATNRHVINAAHFLGVDDNDRAFPNSFSSFEITKNLDQYYLDSVNEERKAKNLELATKENWERVLTESQKGFYRSKLEQMEKAKEINRKRMNKQKSYIKNSGFINFEWKRFDTNDFSTTDPVSSEAIRNGSVLTDAKYSKQITNGYASHPIVNIHKDFLNKETDKYNIDDNNPLWLQQSRQGYLDSVIYFPTFSAGHMANNNPIQTMQKEFAGRAFREQDYNTYTYNFAGLDLALVKMVFKAEDLKRDWKVLYELMQKPIEEQKAFFGKTLAQKPRVDERTNSYIVGYPSAKQNEGGSRVWSYRVVEKGATTSLRDSGLVFAGVGKDTLPAVIKFDQEYWDKYYAPYVAGGIFNKLDEFNGSKSYPVDPDISNPQDGMYDLALLTATETYHSGDHANPGNSGSMVIDANFNNYGIVHAYIENWTIGSRTVVINFVTQDPYARSNIIPNSQPNVRLETIALLDKYKISTLVLNNKNYSSTN